MAKQKKEIINDVLKHVDLGTLAKYNEIHVYGETNKKVQVWLPFIPQINNHINIPVKYKGMELILEQHKGIHAKAPDMIPSLVITRTEKQGKPRKYECIGIYTKVLYDRKNSFTVHVRGFKPDVVNCNSGLFWNTAFVSPENEARKKANDLYKLFEAKKRKLVTQRISKRKSANKPKR